MYIDAVVLLRVNSCMAIEHSGSVNNGLKQKHLTTSLFHKYSESTQVYRSQSPGILWTGERRFVTLGVTKSPEREVRGPA